MVHMADAVAEEEVPGTEKEQAAQKRRSRRKQTMAEEDVASGRRSVGRKKGSGRKKLTEAEEADLAARVSTGRKKGSSRRQMLGPARAMNPFQTDEARKVDAEELLRFVLLVPLRFAVFLLLTVVSTVLMRLVVVDCDLSKPLPKSRARMQEFISWANGRLALACFGVYDITVIGERAPSEECKMMVVGPHSTAMDALVVGTALGSPSGVAKAELETGIMGPFFVATQTVFVDREDGKNRKRASAEMARRVALENKEWHRPMAVFPEGTCTNRTSLIAFRKGSFEPGEPVQPVVITWNVKDFDPAWTAGATDRLMIVLRSFAQLRQSVTVEFLPVYQPDAKEQDDAALYTANVRKVMADALGVKTSDFTYPDMFLAKVAAKRGLKPSMVLPFTFASLVKDNKRHKIGKDVLFETTKALLTRFGKAPGMDGEARMSKEQFKAVANKAASDIDLPKGLRWDAVSKDMRKDDNTIAFHAFLDAHIQAKFSDSPPPSPRASPPPSPTSASS